MLSYRNYATLEATQTMQEKLEAIELLLIKRHQGEKLRKDFLKKLFHAF